MSVLLDVLREVNNFFHYETATEYPYQHSETGSFVISNHVLSPVPAWLKTNQYVHIVGSVFNDGVFKYPSEFTQLVDEEFYGQVYGMAIPADLLALVTEISTYITNNPDSPYASEAFGGYSYSKAANASGRPVSWQDTFGAKLNKYRKA